MGVLQGAKDFTRVFLSSAGAGIPEWAGRTFGGEADAEEARRNATELAAARERLGFTGGVANVLGYAAPGTGALKALKGARYLPTLAKSAGGAVAHAIPAAERAIASRVIPGYAARANALERLSLPAMETISGRVGSAVAAHPVRTAVGATVVGGGAVASENMRKYDAHNYAPQAASAQPRQQQVNRPAAAAPPAPSVASKMSDDLTSSLQASQTPFDQLVDSVAAAQGGKISIAQMGALAEMYDHVQPRGSGATPKPGDAAAAMLERIYGSQFQKSLDAAGDDAARQKAIDDYETKVLQLRGKDYIDPYGLNGRE